MIADAYEGAELCDQCGRESCEAHLPSGAAPTPDDFFLDDAVDVAAEGRAIAAAGVRYLIAGLIPGYGMLGFLVAYAKVGKTTFGQALAAAVAMGRPILDRATQPARVLIIAAEDPPEYTAWLARHLDVTRGRLTFLRAPLVLTPATLARLAALVARERFGLVLIASWQAVIRGLVQDENDNAGAVAVVETVKIAARQTGVPWLIDAHSGKGEDQSDDADPSKAMRGASGAAGAADYTLSLRYAEGAYGTQRRLSGKGRFVSVAPIVFDFDAETSTYTLVGGARDLGRETTWRLITEMGALSDTPRSLTEIARVCGLVDDDNRVVGGRRRQLLAALKGRPDVLVTEEIRRGHKTPLFRQVVA